eukprot:3499084-Amphidinium_carterae.1
MASGDHQLVLTHLAKLWGAWPLAAIGLFWDFLCAPEQARRLRINDKTKLLFSNVDDLPKLVANKARPTPVPTPVL